MSVSLLCLRPRVDGPLATAPSLVLCLPDRSANACLARTHPDYSSDCTVPSRCIVLWKTNYEPQVAMLRTGNGSGFKCYLVNYDSPLMLPKDSLGKLRQGPAPAPTTKKKEGERKSLIKETQDMLEEDK